jgi:hypothetical protein
MRLKDPEAPARPVDASALKAEAFVRVQARKSAPQFKTVPLKNGGPFTSARMQVNESTQFEPPTSLAEWADDRIIRLPAGIAVGSTLIIILSAARTSPAAAAVAVCKAAALDQADQFGVWSALNDMSSKVVSLTEAAHLLAEIREEWRRLGLCTALAGGR